MAATATAISGGTYHKRFLIEKGADADDTVTFAHGLAGLPFVSLYLYNTQIINANLNANTAFIATVSATCVTVDFCSIICTAPASFLCDLFYYSPVA